MPIYSSHQQLCTQYLDSLYEGLHYQYKKTKLAEQPGEILYPSVSKLLNLANLSTHDVFADLGSGLGKAVLQAFLLSPVKEALGIEIVPALHHQAVLVAQRVKNELPDFFVNQRKLTLLQGDFLRLSLAQVTVALICSTCFDQPLLQDLGLIINDTPSIRTVFTLRPIVTLQRLVFKRAVRVECSWDSALCYIYER
ncbi:MAG: hypothetical protein A3E83_03110 [Gammaproteobacteria bacterium RIFCSPHIGHO2_12_FULL_41_20]|nr:MAG: hypothetical protein A3E83_03110 [Gammaproteobacteria bacterium RIFCSPHIGHO2_12_FULL_41_20]